jgi:hypothetical protein
MTNDCLENVRAAPEAKGFKQPQSLKEKEAGMLAQVQKFEDKGDDNKAKAEAKIVEMLSQMLSGIFATKDIDWLINYSLNLVKENRDLRANTAVLARELIRTTLRPLNSVTHPSLRY